MAKFLDTTGVSYHLQQLINKSNEKLYLVSPYLKINEKIKQSLEDRNRMKVDIRVIYGKNELQPEENNWLKSMENLKTFFCKDLHAKCYLSENEAIITSMNLYEFSQVNNNEMGVLISKIDDAELYKETNDEVLRLIRSSSQLKVSVESINAVFTKEDKILETPKQFSGKFLSTTALSKEIGISSKELFAKFEGIGFIKKENDDWALTSKGKLSGAQMKNGQYGEFIAWPDSLIKELGPDDLPF